MEERGTSPVGPAAVAEAVASLRAGWLAVIAIAALGLIAGFLFASRSETITRQSERVELKAVGDNASFVNLGISAPTTISPGEFLDEDLLVRVADRLGVEADDLEGHFHVVGVPDAANLVDLEAAAEDDPEQALEELKVWTDEIQKDRRARIAELLEYAKEGIDEDLEGFQISGRIMKERERALAKLATLKDTLKTDVELRQDPELIVSPGKSKVKYSIAGGILGLVVGIFLILILALFRGIAQTPAGMAARFGAPVVADLADEGAKGQVDQWLAEADHPVIVDASGSDGATAVIAADHPEVKVAGSLGKTGPILPGDAESCLVLVKLGSSGVSESDQLRLVLAQSPQVKSLGIVLV